MASKAEQDATFYGVRVIAIGRVRRTQKITLTLLIVRDHTTRR